MTTPVTDQTTTSTLTGHVFVVRGLLESIACDAVIVPTSSSFRPRDTWFPLLGMRTMGLMSCSNVSISRPAVSTDACCRLERPTGRRSSIEGNPIAIRTHSIDLRRSWSKN